MEFSHSTGKGADVVVVVFVVVMGAVVVVGVAVVDAVVGVVVVSCFAFLQAMRRSTRC